MPRLPSPAARPRRRRLGRPKKSEFAENEIRERILDAAEGVFAEKGLSAAGLREIAKRSGHATSIVTYYFGTKDNLSLAVFERHLAAHRAAIARGMGTDGGRMDLAAMEKVFAQSLAWYSSEQGLRAYRIQVSSKVDATRRMASATSGYWAQSVELIAEMVRQANPKLELAEARERALFLALLMRVRTELHWVYARNTAQLSDPDTVVENYERWLFGRFMKDLVMGSPPAK